MHTGTVSSAAVQILIRIQQIQAGEAVEISSFS